jgi:hypothetical protein
LSEANRNFSELAQIEVQHIISDLSGNGHY